MAFAEAETALHNDEEFLTILEKMDAAGGPVPPFVRPRGPTRKPAKKLEEIVSQHFTF